MFCDICGKIQATVHLTEIVNEQMSELHLCENCARQKSQQMESKFGLADLLAGLADFGKNVDQETQIKVKCPNCGLTYEDFRRIGRLGCSECYTAFRVYLNTLLKKIHGSNQHLGKVPKAATAAVKINKEKSVLQELRIKLQRAIDAEEFEEAARLRDKIRDFEKKGNAKKK